MIVADTNLVFHLFNETSLTYEAQRILSLDSIWIVPPIWKDKYANVLSKLGRKEQRNVNEIIVHFMNTVNEMKDCEIVVETKNALEISMNYKISVYDAYFVFLALENDVILVTEDKELLKKCPQITSSFSKFIKPI
jgi:predicted nucleic acid-binding protein